MSRPITPIHAQDPLPEIKDSVPAQAASVKSVAEAAPAESVAQDEPIAVASAVPAEMETNAAGSVASAISSSRRGSLLTRKATFSKSDMSKAVKDSTTSANQASIIDVVASGYSAEAITTDNAKDIEVTDTEKDSTTSANQASIIDVVASGYSAEAITADNAKEIEVTDTEKDSTTSGELY